VRKDSATADVRIPSKSSRNHCRRSERRSKRNGEIIPINKQTHARNRAGQLIVAQEPVKSTKATAIPLCSDQRKTQRHQLTVAEATAAGSRCSESCRSVDCNARNCKVDEINSNLSVKTTDTSSIVASVPTHRTLSDDSWPTVLGIVPVSRLLCKYLQN
jgi:hypothetical protein